MLYVGNYASAGKLCFGHSWYLIVDMQLYFLSPLVLYPLWRFKHHVKTMISMIFVIASSSVIFIFVIFMVKEFRVSNVSDLSYLKDAMVYTNTLSRVSSWMVGILIGYIMNRIEGKSLKLSKAFLSFGWVFSMLTLLAVIFAQYPLLQVNYLDNALIADAIYEATRRISWCLAVGWIILACHLSQGGFVKRFLSLSIWLPISKLTFCIYLMHIPLMFIHLSSLRIPVYFSHLNAILMFSGYFGVTFFIAFAWALLFEFPTLTIIAIILSRQRKSSKTQQ